MSLLSIMLFPGPKQLYFYILCPKIVIHIPVWFVAVDSITNQYKCISGIYKVSPVVFLFFWLLSNTEKTLLRRSGKTLLSSKGQTLLRSRGETLLRSRGEIFLSWGSEF